MDFERYVLERDELEEEKKMNEIEEACCIRREGDFTQVNKTKHSIAQRRAILVAWRKSRLAELRGE